MTRKGGMASLFVLLAAMLLNGCAGFDYYSQAVSGQIGLDYRARPVIDVLSAPDTPGSIAERLRWAMQIRDFASHTLQLPDNASYRNYVDLQRPYVLWNVVAAPEFSLTARSECFPFAGCVAYRGFFSRQQAGQYADTLRHQGHDVWLYGISAYSTLGWLDDPLLNTFIHHGNVAMARLMFHELAHQQVYVKDDSGFNEAFATAVELEGTRQWLAQFGTQAQQQQMQQTQQRQKHFQQWLLGYRQQLQQLYASSITDIEKRAAKARLMQALAADYRKMQQQWQGYAGYEHWFQPLPNNAHFASLATYHQWVPAFHHLFEEHAGDWAGFYQSVRKLAKMPREQRQQRLMQLQQRGKSDNGGI